MPVTQTNVDKFQLKKLNFDNAKAIYKKPVSANNALLKVAQKAAYVFAAVLVAAIEVFINAYRLVANVGITAANLGVKAADSIKNRFMAKKVVTDETRTPKVIEQVITLPPAAAAEEPARASDPAVDEKPASQPEAPAASITKEEQSLIVRAKELAKAKTGRVVHAHFVAPMAVLLALTAKGASMAFSTPAQYVADSRLARKMSETRLGQMLSNASVYGTAFYKGVADASTGTWIDLRKAEQIGNAATVTVAEAFAPAVETISLAKFYAGLTANAIVDAGTGYVVAKASNVKTKTSAALETISIAKFYTDAGTEYVVAKASNVKTKTVAVWTQAKAKTSAAGKRLLAIPASVKQTVVTTTSNAKAAIDETLSSAKQSTGAALSSVKSTVTAMPGAARNALSATGTALSAIPGATKAKAAAATTAVTNAVKNVWSWMTTPSAPKKSASTEVQPTKPVLTAKAAKRKANKEKWRAAQQQLMTV